MKTKTNRKESKPRAQKVHCRVTRLGRWLLRSTCLPPEGKQLSRILASLCLLLGRWSTHSLKGAMVSPAFAVERKHQQVKRNKRIKRKNTWAFRSRTSFGQEGYQGYIEKKGKKAHRRRGCSHTSSCFLSEDFQHYESPLGNEVMKARKLI